MFIYYFLIFFLFLIKNIQTNQIEINIPSISSSHIFELSSNISNLLHRNVLYGLVDGTSSSISSSILVQTSYEQISIEYFFNLYESKNKYIEKSIKKEPIFRSYLLTPSFNRSYPFIRVLIASTQGSYENLSIQPLCAIITAVNEQNLYETDNCFISPTIGYCLSTISLLKMIESINKNQTTKKIELYLKLHHVQSSNECISDYTSKQDHIHHETRIGQVEYIENENILYSTQTYSIISIDYPIGIHYPNWYFPLKLKLKLSSSLFISSSFLIRFRLIKIFSIYLIQTNILQILNYNIQINDYISYEQSLTYINFNLTIKQINKTEENQLFEIDLATIILIINSTKNIQDKLNSILFIDSSILLNNLNETILQIPIHVQYDDIQTIVGLTDFTSLINTAMLSMQIQQFPLKILAVNYSGLIQPINQAVCHSENVDLIKVDSTCNYIYFSGHEREDFFDQINNPPSIIIRYEKYLHRLDFIIYIPERPLRIELTDTKLSRISGWFIREQRSESPSSSSSSSSSAIHNDIDDDDDEEDDEDDEDEDDEFKCYPVYQQSDIQVYTKFYRTTSNGDRIYLFNKQNVIVTSFVRNHLETDNTKIAVIKNGRVIGIGPGKTNIRIYSFDNKLPMGSKTLYVDDHELIQIKNISFNILTNIDIETNLIEHIDPIYKINFQIKPIFNRFNIENKNQFGQINIILTYSDNTSISLDDIPLDYYQFEFDSTRLNSSLIYINSSQLSFYKTYHIYPLAMGQTNIHARLKLGQQQCTDDRIYSQNFLSCEIIILSNNLHQLNKNNNNNIHSSSYKQSDHYIILNNKELEHRHKTSPFLITLSILLGACVVLFISFLLHWFINCYVRKKSNENVRRQRHSTHSGAEEDNHDWIFLDRNSLEIPINQQQQQPNSPSIHNSTLHITSNPLINTPTLQRQEDLPELSHSQMIAYFDNLKESHA